MSDPNIAQAKLRSERARRQLGETIIALKHRLLPRTVAHRLLEATKAKTTDVTTASVDAIGKRPGLAIGAAALAALFFARKLIARAFSSDEQATGPASARSTKRRAPFSAKPIRKAKP